MENNQPKTHKVQPIEAVILKHRDGHEEVIEVSENGHIILSVAHVSNEDDEGMGLEIRQRVLASMQVRMAMIESLREDAMKAMKSELPEGLSKLLDALEDAVKRAEE